MKFLIDQLKRRVKSKRQNLLIFLIDQRKTASKFIKIFN